MYKLIGVRTVNKLVKLSEIQKGDWFIDVTSNRIFVKGAREGSVYVCVDILNGDTTYFFKESDMVSKVKRDVQDMTLTSY